MTSHHTRLKAITLGLSGLALLGLAACDRQSERTERAQKLGGAVLDQILGEGDGAATKRLDNVPLEARAMAGSILAQAEISEPEGEPRRFVIGSIVAKPRDLAPTIAMAQVMAEPELADTIVTDELPEAKIVILDEETTARAEEDLTVISKIEKFEQGRTKVAVIDPTAPSQTRSLSMQREGTALPRRRLSEEIQRKRNVNEGIAETRSLRVMPPPPTREEKIQAMPQLPPELAKRALTLREDTLQKQLMAEDRMIQAANKYGVAASIQRSRTGQMVIEIGADAMSPTAFTAQSMSQQTFAVETEAGCNENEARAGNAVYAMNCVIQDLEASGEFEYVEKDYLFDHQMIRTPGGDSGTATTVSVTPNDPLFDLQWHFRNQGDGSDQSPGGAGFVDFWTREATQGSTDVVVAVVDTGLEMAHPDIASSPNVAKGWDMVTDPATGNDGDGRDDDPNDPGDMCPERGAFSDSFHGTHVAGTVGAGITNNATGVAGGAWNVKIVPVRALGRCGGRLSDINDAIRWAAGTIPEFDELGNEVWNENPADIINLSIGLFKACPASMQDAIDAVTAEGVVVVAAAGNKRISTQYFAPAGCRNVVTVASSDARGFLAPYSNYGDAVDILAPGGDLSRDDNGDGNPDGVLSTKTAENCFDPVSGAAVEKCFYAYEQGTSMAAPHVSAALALIKAKRPELTASELVSRLSGGLSSVPEAQCTGSCSQYPGAVPTAEDPDICLRPCGAGLLNLAGTDLSD